MYCLVVTYDIQIESWNLSFRTGLFNNRDMPKYSLFNMIALIFSYTHQSVERRGKQCRGHICEANHHAIGCWIPDSKYCTVATAFEPGYQPQWCCSRSVGVHSGLGCCERCQILCNSASVTCCTLLAMISCGIVHCDVGCGVVCTGLGVLRGHV